MASDASGRIAPAAGDVCKRLALVETVDDVIVVMMNLPHY
jgi:hypothetical protein